MSLLSLSPREMLIFVFYSNFRNFIVLLVFNNRKQGKVSSQISWIEYALNWKFRYEPKKSVETWKRITFLISMIEKRPCRKWYTSFAHLHNLIGRKKKSQPAKEGVGKTECWYLEVYLAPQSRNNSVMFHTMEIVQFHFIFLFLNKENITKLERITCVSQRANDSTLLQQLSEQHTKEKNIYIKFTHTRIHCDDWNWNQTTGTISKRKPHEILYFVHCFY